MLNRNSVGAGVVALAILFSAALSYNALGQPFANGDVITYSQTNWGETPSGNNAAAILDDNYFEVYFPAPTFHVVEVGISGAAGFSLLFTDESWVLEYLPALGPIGPLSSDHVDTSSISSSESGAFGGEVMALRLNIDFSDDWITLGALAIPFGDLELHSMSAHPLLNGLKVRQFSAEVNNLLGGGSGVYSIAELNPIIEDLNHSFSGGVVSYFARDHLRIVTEPVSFADGDFITHPQASWGDPNPTPSNAAGLLEANYAAVYAPSSGLFEVGLPSPTSFSMVFNNPTSVLSYLPAFGLDGPLTSDHVNPNSTAAGEFGGEVAALAINVDFSDAGVTLGGSGIPFGDLELHGLAQTQYNGLTVRELLNSANFQLSGSSMFHNIFQLNPIVEELNAAFTAGTVSPWARNHLRVAGLPGDYNDDDVVDAADYVVWRKSEGTMNTLPNDPNGGTVDADQYNTWRANFGQTAPGSGSGATGSASAVVPEPASCILWLIASWSLITARRSRRAWA